MGLAQLALPKAKSVLGIDASTNSIAFCKIEDGKPIFWGEIKFEGADVFERLLDAKRKVRAFKKELDYDFVVIEAAVTVKSVQTGLKMAYVFGAILGALIHKPSPIPSSNKAPVSVAACNCKVDSGSCE